MPDAAYRYCAAAVLALGLSGSQKLARPGRRSAEESAARSFKRYCSGCHGSKGQGGRGANLQGLSDSTVEIAAIIRNGQGKMPAFGRRLTARQIQQLAVYVKGLKQ